MANITSADPGVTFDDRDRELADQRQVARSKRHEPLDGDWVEFPDGIVRRVSYVWAGGVQTSDGGSWYLSLGGGGSFSGGLYGSVPMRSLTDTKTVRPARFWFFHHDHAQGHNGVNVDVDVRVWKCDLPAPF